jgi:alcohol dehydrogenase
MMSFQHIAPPLRLFSGADSLAAIGRELDRLKCHRALIFCGSSMAKEGSPLASIRVALGKRCGGVFSGVRAHSPLPAVEEGAREIGRLNADAAIALGGGSAIVTARASSILAAEGRSARALATNQDAAGKVVSPKLLAPKILQFVVPTTPTTAMVRAGSAVFDPVAKHRLALFDPKTRAHAIFLHPEVLRSAPRALVVSSGINTFAMAIEGLCSRSGDPLADALLMHALRLIAQHLPVKDDEGTDVARNELAVAAVMCGQGTEYTGLGIPSALGHAIGARCGIENGIANAIVLPHALRFNGDGAASGPPKVATALGCKPSIDGVCETLAAIFGRLGIPLLLRDAGVPRDALPEIAANAMGDWFLRGNPRTVRSADELVQLLDAAW